MLTINEVKIDIETNLKRFSFSSIFKKGVNLIYSEGNTVGKSSVISAIYYAIGLEEIIGGKGPNVLSSAFKTQIEYDEKEIPVLESKVYLEISNGIEPITIFRAAKSSTRGSNLITVYFSSLDKINDLNIKKEDYYVHLHNSAKHQKGFYTFLESFLQLNLPYVPSKNEEERKLYLQLIFSSMFIEQKRGWGDIFSGMPYYDILDQKKRVIEYILGLDTLANEKLKYSLKNEEKLLKEKWENLYKQYSIKLNPYKLELKGINKNIHIIEKDSIDLIYTDNELNYNIKDYIKILEDELQELNKVKIKKKENLESLIKEVEETKNSIKEFEDKLKNTTEYYDKELSSLKHLQNSLEMINIDILNNKDALKLQNLGSMEKFKTFDNFCPTCEQPIQDTILTNQMSTNIMSIEENINHLESQKKLFEYAITQKENTIIKLKEDIKTYRTSIKKLYFLLQITNNDLYSPVETYSEKSVYRKVELQKLIYDLYEVILLKNEINESFYNLSSEWKLNQDSILKLPNSNLTFQDINKLDKLRAYFIENLNTFGYRSSLDINKVQISKDTYMPMIEQFDMKFDSSASDHIRRIWAFTIALLQTSIEMNGNHPGILIFDEPGQHSIIVDDMKKFFNVLSKIKGVQIIIGITIKESDIRKVVLEEVQTGSFGIPLINRAFS
ncbi:hypothetical protein [Lysinibacillus halotolerans]|uniref:Rad50/SbcC-type AAA domain-containing protein n=1 Tax=Lysinibacillus halotolerans TaxID=1368476 RepID=A0A3M8H785_9BACI|nr:hypothetical protein [Lysinibacillus halotolerans]RNC98267.1 hypothetical protein EC501_11720 [Lysinibacillus halotolerans]